MPTGMWHGRLKACGTGSLVEARAATAAEQRRVHGSGGVRALVAAPGKQEPNHWEAAGPERCAYRVAVPQVREVQVTSVEGDFTFVHHGGYADRTPDRMFEAGARQNGVRGAEAVVRITRERRIAVQVRSAERRLKVERHDVSGGREGLVHEETQR